jgi:peptidoglycan/xylan/chitin deacetylase (PgdA/CDA1 family)
MGKYMKFIRRKWANISFSKKMEIRLDQPVVSFTFDDAPSSAFNNGGAILERYG